MKILEIFLLSLPGIPAALYLMDKTGLSAHIGLGTKYAETPLELTQMLVMQPLVTVAVSLGILLVILLVIVLGIGLFDSHNARQKKQKDSLYG